MAGMRGPGKREAATPRTWNVARAGSAPKHNRAVFLAYLPI